MSERLIVGLSGHSGTGKSTICNYMKAEHGFLVLEGSTILKQYASEAGVSLTSRDTYEDFFRQRQRSHGKTWLSDITLSTAGDRVLQGGLRSKYDLHNIKRAGGFVLALICPPLVALQRIDTSNPKNPRTADEYEQHLVLEESADDYGLNTAWCVANADYSIDTANPLEQTYADIDKALSEMTK